MATQTSTATSVPTFPWWIVLVEGFFTLIFGIFLISAPGATSVFLVTVLGFYWLIRGIFSIVEIFIPNTVTHWGWLLLLGILAGMVVLRHPLYATVFVGTFLVLFLAINGLIMGIVGVIRAFTGAGWGAGIMGVLTIIVALFLFSNVFGAVIALPLVIGLFMMIGGIAAIFFSFRLRRVLVFAQEQQLL